MGRPIREFGTRSRLLTIILPITVAIIFALLFLTFGSVGYVGLALMNVPFSLVGGVIALCFRGDTAEVIP